MADKYVSVVLGQDAFVDGEVKPAGTTVLVPEHMAEALTWKPSHPVKAKTDEKKPDVV